MKKAIAIFISVLMIVSFAIAETDISSMSYDDLIKLQKELVFEIMSRPEWKEVTVPAGTWIVGEQIPEGVYSVRSASDDLARLVCESNGRQIEYIWLSEDEQLGRIELVAGYTVELTNSVIFAPPVSLDF